MIKYILTYDDDEVSAEEINDLAKYLRGRDIDIVYLPKIYQLKKSSEEELLFMKDNIEKALADIEMMKWFESEEAKQVADWQEYHIIAEPKDSEEPIKVVCEGDK